MKVGTEEDLFTLIHKKVLDIGTYDEEFENPKEQLMSGRSGQYGPGLDEDYGVVWALTFNELEDYKNAISEERLQRIEQKL